MFIPLSYNLVTFYNPVTLSGFFILHFSFFIFPYNLSPLRGFLFLFTLLSPKAFIVEGRL